MSTPDDFFPSRTTLGGRRSPRPIGAGDTAGMDARSGLSGPPRGTRVADAGKTDRSRKPAPKADAKSTVREITIVGSFKNPFKGTADEIQAMKENRWEPSTDDFRAVAGNSVTVDHFHQIFAAILVDGTRETKAGSIRRINIFTHANPAMIAFSGTITSVNAMASVGLRTDGALTPGDLQDLTQGQTFQVGSTNKTLAAKSFTLADVRGRFAKDAIIVVYACKSGIEVSFLQEIANTFQVKVRGFNDLIGYFPEYSEGKTPAIKRRRTGVGLNAAVKTNDFHELDSHSNAVNRSPKAGSSSPSVTKPSDDDE